MPGRPDRGPSNTQATLFGGKTGYCLGTWGTLCPGAIQVTPFGVKLDVALTSGAH